MSGYFKRTKISFVCALFLLLCIVPAVSAQQITAPTTPNTQNPQPTQSDIIKSESNVQESSDATLLNNADRRITVEAGSPLPAPADAEDERSLTRLWLAIFGGLLTALLTTALLSRLAKASTKHPQAIGNPAEDNAPATKEEAKAKTSQPAQKPKKHPTSKKKKRRSKKKKS